MQEFQLKYGCNPHQAQAKLRLDGGNLPLSILNGKPGYINFLDALNAWQLVRELKAATGLAAATSFKHVSPAGAALGLVLDDLSQQIYFVADIPHINNSPLACAYARARGSDRMSAFGDFIALSDICDATTALVISREVSDGVIAPGFSPEALEILKQKRQGTYNVIQIDPSYAPATLEIKQVFGIIFEQNRNDLMINSACLENIVTKTKTLPDTAKRDLLLALITLKYTQSNSVCYAYQGQTIGVGAGQQSRIHCTRLAGDKADIWQLRHHPKVLSLPFKPDLKRADRDNVIDVYISPQAQNVLAGSLWQRTFTEQPKPISPEERGDWLSKSTEVALASDAFFPFSDNIERAKHSGVSYIAQPGGSVRDAEVIATCDKYKLVMAMTGQRLFHH